MTKKERVLAAVSGEETEGVPSGFSIHFPKEKSFGEAGINAHLDFFRETDTDILKIMNENLVPYAGDIWEAEDWKLIRTITGKEEFIQNQIEFVKRILDRCGDDGFTMGTLHGITASTTHPLKKQFRYDYHGPRQFLCEELRKHPEPVKDAMKRIAEGMCILAEKYVEAGLDSIYYASLGGEHRYFTEEEFETYIAPLDQMILKAAKEAGACVFLHICKDEVNIRRYRNYVPFVDVVNWGVYEVPCSLKEGRDIFPGVTVMGGLKNRDGVLENGSPEEIERTVKQIIGENGSRGFILGADCTLPTEIPYENIRRAAYAARFWKNNN